jgi:hypothetical protein
MLGAMATTRHEIPKVGVGDAATPGFPKVTHCDSAAESLYSLLFSGSFRNV